MLAHEMDKVFRFSAGLPHSFGARLLNLRGEFGTARLDKEIDPAQNLRRFADPTTGTPYQFSNQTHREAIAAMKGLFIPQAADCFQVRGLAQPVAGLRPGNQFAVLVEAYKMPSLLGSYYLLEVDTAGNTIVSVKTMPNAY